MSYRPPARTQRLNRPRSPRLSLGPGGLETEASPLEGGRLRCTGWAWPFEERRVRSVTLLVDGAHAADARLTLRPDIAEALGLPEAALSGFEAELDLSTAGDRESIALSAVARALDGETRVCAEQVVTLEPATPDSPRTVQRRSDPPRPAQRNPRPDAPLDRELLRRRLGYDPWHSVVLIDEPVDTTVAGLAIAALDVLAERYPNLELLVADVPRESVLADCLQRTIAATGLRDRVTLVDDEIGTLERVTIADSRLEDERGTDLAETIATLSAAAGGTPTSDRHGGSQRN